MALASYAMYVTMNAPDGNLVQTAVTEEWSAKKEDAANSIPDAILIITISTGMNNYRAVACDELQHWQSTIA